MSSTMPEAVLEYGARARPPRQLVAWSALPTVSVIAVVGDSERRLRFGYALQQVLKKRQLSERQLALELKLDPRTVAAWRTGRKLPNLYEAQELVRVLRVTADLFLNPPEVPKPTEYPIERYLLENVQELDAAADEALGEPFGDEATDDQRPSPAEQR